MQDGYIKYLWEDLRAQTLVCAPKAPQQPILPSLPATCHTHENQKKRKTLTPGMFLNKKLANENAVLKRFQISVSNPVSMIGRRNDHTCGHGWFGMMHTWCIAGGPVFIGQK